MAHDLHAALGIVAVQASQDFVVREAITLLDRGVFGGPRADDRVVVLLRTFLINQNARARYIRSRKVAIPHYR